MPKKESKLKKGLVIIAAETSYLDAVTPPRVSAENAADPLYFDETPPAFDLQARDNLEEVFDRIVEVAAAYKEAGDPVYFLAENSNAIDTGQVYPPLRQHLNRRRFFKPADSTEEQLLIAKKAMIDDGVRVTEVTGIAHDLCVRDMQALLDGHLQVPQYSSFEEKDLESVASNLGWSAQRLNEVVTTPFASSIRRDLTDAAFRSEEKTY